MTRGWWRRLLLQGKVFGFAHNRYVINDSSQPEEFHSLNDVPHLRMFLVHALITTLLVVSAVGIWRLG
jgi:hypothetical protein